MKKKIKIISVIAVVIIMVAYSIYTYLQPMAVETKTLEAEDSEITFTESGIVVHSGEKAIYPLAPGEIVSVLVKEGDMVTKDQVLAELDTEVLDNQISQAASALEAYKAQLAGAETEHEVGVQNLKASRAGLVGQLKALSAGSGTSDQRALEQLLKEQSKAIYDQGLIDLEKNRELLELGVISQSESTAFEQLVQSYEANYLQSQIGATGGNDVYQGSKSALNAQIEAIDATLKLDTLSTTKAYYKAMIDSTDAAYEALRSQGNLYNITSPISGVVNSVTIENTNMVTGMAPAFIVQGDGEAQIEVKVSTRDIGTVTVGDKVRLILDQRTGDLELVGTISYIASNAVVEISPLGIEERMVMVYIEPENDDNLGAGYEVDAKFTVFSEGNKLVIPNSALYKIDGQDTVMVIKSGKAVEVPVTLGYELTGESIVEAGLAEGDMVIIDLDASDLSPGKNATSSTE